MNERMNERTQGRPLPSREGKPSSPPTTVCLPGWEEPGGGPVKGTAAPPPSLQAPQLVGGCPGLQGGFFCPGGQSRVCPDRSTGSASSETEPRNMYSQQTTPHPARGFRGRWPFEKHWTRWSPRTLPSQGLMRKRVSSATPLKRVSCHPF